MQLNALYGCHGNRFSEKSYNVLILWRFIYVCGKFHTDTIDQTVFGKEFVKLLWEIWKLFGATLKPMPKTVAAWINPELNLIFFRCWKVIYHLTVAAQYSKGLFIWAGQARFPRSRLHALSFVKVSMCSYEKPGWPGYQYLDFATEILVTGKNIFPYEYSSPGNRDETF